MPKQLANHDDPPDRDERGDDGWQHMTVANPTFLLERLGAECGDLQFLRVPGGRAVVRRDDGRGLGRLRAFLNEY